MKITIVTWGSSGDIVPYIALSLGLQHAGHTVQLATYSQHQEIVNSYGIKCVPIDLNVKEIEYPELFIHSTLRTIIYQSRLLQLYKEKVLPECWRICQDTEAIIFGSDAHPIYEIVEKLGIPSYCAFAQPLHQTYAFPHPYMPCRFDLGGIYNWLSYPFFDQLSWQFFRKSLNEWRGKSLNLSSLSHWVGIVRRMHQQQIPCLYSYSPSVLPKPSDWPDWIHVTGYWFLDRPADWQAPTNLVNFLSAGTPPVYITNNKNLDLLTKEAVIEVLALTGQRIIVQSLDDDAELPDEVFNIKQWIPHEWLLPQVAAIVHHGGCGTTMSSLRAGVPTIIIPSITDQFFWGNRVAKLGLGPISILRKQFSAKRLAAAILAAISDKKMQDCAAAMGKLIQAEKGVMLAVEAFHHHLPSNLKPLTTSVF
ncbi:MAG: glycosyltransferase family 1 protein [Nostoc sp. JL34]|uniref:glycosyltransferase n=1 Tax=Nostoc sp. JL34 TaxID=2815397 RepID=UPI001D1F559D|nr:glycosyltransferase [Nostoc sp. JL34]MBN3884985.1 glycosyltransferase family 1 protein [Nostoc sp. JL34]